MHKKEYLICLGATIGLCWLLWYSHQVPAEGNNLPSAPVMVPVAMTPVHMEKPTITPKIASSSNKIPESSETGISTPTVSEDVQELVRPAEAYTTSDDEATMLKKLAWAEASGDGVEGKAMVMQVVLNRIKNKDIFADVNTVQDVIFQSGQFAPIRDGSYKKAKPDQECEEAYQAVMNGEYADRTALFFSNSQKCWAARHRKYLYKVGHHYFYE